MNAVWIWTDRATRPSVIPSLSHTQPRPSSTAAPKTCVPIAAKLWRPARTLRPSRSSASCRRRAANRCEKFFALSKSSKTLTLLWRCDPILSLAHGMPRFFRWIRSFSIGDGDTKVITATVVIAEQKGVHVYTCSSSFFSYLLLWYFLLLRGRDVPPIY